MAPTPRTEAGGPRATAIGSWDVRRDRGERIRGPRRRGAPGHRRTSTSTHCCYAERTYAAGDACRRPRAEGAFESGDRRAVVHQPKDGRVPPTQGLHEACDQLAQRAPAGAAERSRRGTAGLAESRAHHAPRDLAARTREWTRALPDASSAPTTPAPH